MGIDTRLLEQLYEDQFMVGQMVASSQNTVERNTYYLGPSLVLGSNYSLGGIMSEFALKLRLASALEMFPNFLLSYALG